MLAIVLKIEKQFRLKHKEIVQIHIFRYLCYIITTSSINLDNHLKKTRRIDLTYIAMAGVLDFIGFFLRHPFWTMSNAKVVFRYWARKNALCGRK